MPQMAPISWLILFVVFSMTFLIFNSLNYYNFFVNDNVNNQKSKKNNKSIFLLNWKW